ncbi:MAG: BCCT family transporter [Gammaproteobacteria bacterium]|nr:BCCT family transporter [Gammaproteobacteria bacterium]
MFIARVSRGRTIREFVTGVLLVPAGFTFLWLTVFGDTALHYALLDGTDTIVTMVQDNMPVALFVLLNKLPWSAVMSLLATILVITFFVTSSDSGSLVIDMLTSGGRDDTSVWQRIFWAVSEGIVAAVLLLAGGLAALQTAAIASALPFAIIMLFICYGLLRGLQISHRGMYAPSHLPALAGLGAVGQGSWQHRLLNLFTYHGREEVIDFLQQKVKPALERVAAEFIGQQLKAEVNEMEDRITFIVYHDGHKDFVYTVRLRQYRMPNFVFPEFSFRRAQERLLPGGGRY